MEPYYADEHAIIYHADCREMLPTIGDVDLVLTDPPYESEAHTQQRRVKRGGGVMAIEPLSFAPMDDSLRAIVAREVGRLLRRWVLTFCQIEATGKWAAAYESAGLLYKRTCVWVKPDGMPQYSGDRPGMGYETFVVAHVPGRSTWNGGGRHGVFVCNKNESGGLPNDHPTTKPLALIADLVRLFSDPGDLVLDPFMGSGTTLVAAKQLGRKSIGIEINEEYCRIAVNRLKQQVLPLSPLACCPYCEVELYEPVANHVPRCAAYKARGLFPAAGEE